MSKIPADPFILMSFINMHLRDEGVDLAELCSRLDIDRRQLVSKLSDAGFEYKESINQFR